MRDRVVERRLDAERCLAEGLEIFTTAYRRVSGLARTVRGPSMSATPGKVLIDGIAEAGGERMFALKFLQAREPSWVNRVFFARYDPHATWLKDLVPAFGEKQFFFQEALDAPRLFPWAGKVQAETGIPAATLDVLARMGHTPELMDKPHGGGQAIWIDHEAGALAGGSDPRKDGCAMGY